MAIAIFGGTFDPPHLGHLIIAEQAREDFSLEKVIFMPTGIPPHKIDKIISPASIRLEMLKIVIKDNSFFEYSDYELNKKENSYTADTLRYLQGLNMNDIYFIIGADSLLDIFLWREPEFLLENSKFIVAGRPGYSIKNIYQDLRYRPYLDNILIMDSNLIDISSTSIRKDASRGRSIKYRVADKIINYIKKENLYRGE